jgi:hypothetical protein
VAEQRFEKPLVGGSIPSSANFYILFCGFDIGHGVVELVDTVDLGSIGLML